jgi:hypothetical protein
MEDRNRFTNLRNEDAAYQRGQSDALVRTIQEQLQSLNISLRALEQGFTQMREARVTREEFTSLALRVEGLSRWQWMLTGAMGLIVFLSQILPRILDIGKKLP